ncbi:hypothetical protein BC832DRAFT_148759 [Gaertneriomyces semiglobifer]|nr:hypothetical protein BC832DRAFT_148759 [Gaertneriomyces semiglobifer]
MAIDDILPVRVEALDVQLLQRMMPNVGPTDYAGQMVGTFPSATANLADASRPGMHPSTSVKSTTSTSTSVTGSSAGTVSRNRSRVHKCLRIPNQAAIGRLIGKKGVTINAIQQDTNATVRIDRESMLCVVVGNADQCEAAKKLVQNVFVDDYDRRALPGRYAKILSAELSESAVRFVEDQCPRRHTGNTLLACTLGIDEHLVKTDDMDPEGCVQIFPWRTKSVILNQVTNNLYSFATRAEAPEPYVSIARFSISIGKQLFYPGSADKHPFCDRCEGLFNTSIPDNCVSNLEKRCDGLGYTKVEWKKVTVWGERTMKMYLTDHLTRLGVFLKLGVNMKTEPPSITLKSYQSARKTSSIITFLNAHPTPDFRIRIRRANSCPVNQIPTEIRQLVSDLRYDKESQTIIVPSGRFTVATFRYIRKLPRQKRDPSSTTRVSISHVVQQDFGRAKSEKTFWEVRLSSMKIARFLCREQTLEWQALRNCVDEARRIVDGLKFTSQHQTSLHETPLSNDDNSLGIIKLLDRV